jgi:hypothetical protein
MLLRLLKSVRILCTCKEKQSLHPSLLRFIIIDAYIKLSTRMDGRARYCILHHMVFLRNRYYSSDIVVAHAMDSWLLSQRLHIEQDTDGYRPSDLFILACRSMVGRWWLISSERAAGRSYCLSYQVLQSIF